MSPLPQNWIGLLTKHTRTLSPANSSLSPNHPSKPVPNGPLTGTLNDINLAHPKRSFQMSLSNFKARRRALCENIGLAPNYDGIPIGVCKLPFLHKNGDMSREIDKIVGLVELFEEACKQDRFAAAIAFLSEENFVGPFERFVVRNRFRLVILNFLCHEVQNRLEPFFSRASASGNFRREPR